MNDRNQFLATIAADPTNKTARLIFADWLDEQGLPVDAILAHLLRESVNGRSKMIADVAASAFGVPVSCIDRRADDWRTKAARICDIVAELTSTAERIVAAITADWQNITKRVAKLKREQAWLDAAAEGNVDAILSHPKIRGTLLNGGITTYTGKRKAIAEAKAKMAGREARRVDRRIAEKARTATSGKYAAKYAAKLIAFSLAVGESYHKHVKSLYTSERASVVQGSGNSDGYDADAYSKAYRSKFGGARWKDAGALVSGGNILLYTSRGTKVATIPMPCGKDRVKITFKGLLDGDLWAVEKRKIGGCRLLSRRGLKRGKLVETGLSLLVNGAWEHGATIADIRAELDRKAALAEAAKQSAALSAKAERMARLVAKLCPGLVVTHEDGKLAGYCDAGREAFLGRFGLAGQTESTAARLREIKDERVEKPIMEAARRVVKQRLAVA